MRLSLHGHLAVFSEGLIKQTHLALDAITPKTHLLKAFIL